MTNHPNRSKPPKAYNISNLRSGKYLGEYQGENSNAAARAMWRDAGYGDDAAVVDALGLDSIDDALAQLVITRS
jgi:hypothetical protein